jgi:D-alanyl-D-alanine dipeptidase
MPFAVRTLLLLLSLGLPHIASAGEAERPEHMVYLRTIDPGIAQDIRYASAHNFTGHPLDGYAAPECLLSVNAAKALSRASGLAGARLRFEGI